MQLLQASPHQRLCSEVEKRRIHKYLNKIQNNFKINLKNDADIHLISNTYCLSIDLVAIILKRKWCWQIQLICESRDKQIIALEHPSTAGGGLDKPGTDESWIKSGLSGSEVSGFGSLLPWRLASSVLLLLLLTPPLLLCACMSSLLGPSGAPCRHSTLLLPGSTLSLDTREAKQRWLQSQDSYHTILQKTNDRHCLACLLLFCDDAMRTHRSPARFGSHTCAEWTGLVLQGLDWALCLKWTENGSFCRSAWREQQQPPAGKHHLHCY